MAGESGEGTGRIVAIPEKRSLEYSFSRVKADTRRPSRVGARPGSAPSGTRAGESPRQAVELHRTRRGAYWLMIGISLLARPFGFSTWTTWGPAAGTGAIVSSISPGAGSVKEQPAQAAPSTSTRPAGST